MKQYLTKLLLGLPTDPILYEVHQMDYHVDGSGALMALAPCAGIPAWIREKCPRIMEAIERLEFMRNQKALHVMVNRLPPGTIVPNHTDTLSPVHGIQRPRLERWHLPVLTNEHAMYWEVGRGWDHMPLGYWSGTVRYWEEHAVENTGETERIHVVVDLDPGPIGG